MMVELEKCHLVRVVARGHVDFLVAYVFLSLVSHLVIWGLIFIFKTLAQAVLIITCINSGLLMRTPGVKQNLGPMGGSGYPFIKSL